MFPGVGANLSVVWCVDSSGEQLLNLTCGSASLIRINSVIHGWRNAIQEEDPSGCLAPTQDICAEKYPNIRLLVDTCSSLSTCVFSSLEIPAPLSSCSGRRSNYVNITYECVIGKLRIVWEDYLMRLVQCYCLACTSLHIRVCAIY